DSRDKRMEATCLHINKPVARLLEFLCPFFFGSPKSLKAIRIPRIIRLHPLRIIPHPPPSLRLLAPHLHIITKLHPQLRIEELNTRSRACNLVCKQPLAVVRETSEQVRSG